MTQSLKTLYDEYVDRFLSTSLSSDVIYNHGFEQAVIDLEEKLLTQGYDYSIKRCFEARAIESDFTKNAVEYAIKNFSKQTDICEHAFFKLIVIESSQELNEQLAYEQEVGREDGHYGHVSHDTFGETGRI